VADYGHDLTFGTFLTPLADRPAEVLELAQLSDELGLDLVTVQDHPYQARFLDTWTLLAVIAAATVNVTVAPNVANLPLRPPAVLAKSVATHDILSRGRVELGLGAGAFWDAIAAVGGERRSPAEAVDALEEAIGVIRALWDTASRSARRPGAHYSLAGAHPGPAPVHQVEIWLGAYKPRMLRLTGRLADGWLPTAAYAGPAELSEMNRRIDEAAVAAGREPAAIRRLYNVNGTFSSRRTGFLGGPPRQWAEELAELALVEGMSSFILASDDPDEIRRFANEVVPSTRELVAAARRAESRAPEADVAEPAQQTAESDGSGAGRGWVVQPTPDDGTRLSATRVWDESTRPQPPAYRERDVLPHDVAVAQHLIDVHDHLRGELARVRDLMEQVIAGSMSVGSARSHIQTMTIRQNKWTLGTYCESYCRVVTTHHTIEDQSMFPHLRRSDAALSPVLDRLAEEHHAIHGVLEEVDRALVGFVSGPDGEAGLREAVDLLTDTLLSHLAYEERSLVNALARFGLS
jgi:alkanesulfonate monooxygenase SsuD/methylene tetrahydromethanopterin reductase-like flavin-dependent oxidoreductase (luciferase family)